MTTYILPQDNQLSTKSTQDRNPAIAYIARLQSPASKRTMAKCLNTIAALYGFDKVEIPSSRPRAKVDNVTYQYVPWQSIESQHIGALVSQLAAKYAPSTANKHLAALRGVLKECWRLEYITQEHYSRLIDFDRVKGQRIIAGRNLEPGEIGALASICDNTPAGIRDSAIIGLLATNGLRRAEVVKLQLDDLDTETGALTILGKGNKQRTAYARNGCLAAIKDWLAIRGDEPGPLFCKVYKGGNIAIKPLTSQALYNMLGKRGKQAGITDFSPHDFRRTVAGDLLDRGVDIATVAALLGHSSVNTTKRYDRRGERAKMEAVTQLHYPYTKKTSA